MLLVVACAAQPAPSASRPSPSPSPSALFVRTGWIWRLEEKPCVQSPDNACFDPTIPDGKVLAFDIASGHETAVTFAAGETPFDPKSYVGMNPGELWPNA